MKIRLFFLLLVLNFSSSYSQSIQINQITPSNVSGGINLNLLVHVEDCINIL